VKGRERFQTLRTVPFEAFKCIPIPVDARISETNNTSSPKSFLASSISTGKDKEIPIRDPPMKL
jgi:hypothetical protein